MTGKSQQAKEPTVSAIGESKSQLLRWAKESTRSAAELNDACGRFPEVDRAVASHPNASSELLAKLSHSSDKATRARVAANPATPPANLVRLGQQFPKEFLENPALDLLMLENPALLEQVPQSLLLRLLKSDRCPVEFLHWAAGHTHEKVQLAVATNTNSPPKALERLQASQHNTVQETINSINEAQSWSIGQDPEQGLRDAVTKRLRSLSWKRVRQAWKKGDIGPAQYMSLSPLGRLAVNDMSIEFAIGLAEKGIETDVLMESLARSTESEDRILVAKSSKLNAELIKLLARDKSFEVRDVLTLNQFMPQSLTDWMLESFDQNGNVESIRRIAKSSRTTGKVLEVLAHWDKSSSLKWIDDVRCSVAKNPSTPPSVLAEIALRKDRASKAVILNKKCPEHLIRKILQPWLDNHFQIQEARRREGVSSVEFVPGSPLYAFAFEGKVSRLWVEEITRIGETRLHIALAANKHSPTDFLSEWSRSPEFDIRLAVAGNESSPIEAVSLLALAPEKEIRNAVALNPRTPAPLLETLSKDKSLQSRSFLPDIYSSWRMDWCQSVGLNQAATELALDNIAASCDFNSDLHLLCKLGGHPSASRSLIQRLSKHHSKDIRYTVHKNPALPIDIMRLAVSSTDRWARLGVARNPSASKDALVQLASDRDKWIRSAAALHPVTPLEIAAEVAGAFMSQDWKRSSRVNKLVAKATDAMKDACETGNIFFSAMRDQEAATRSRRPVASLMAVCSGPYIQPVQMVRLSRSTDWLIRAEPCYSYKFTRNSISGCSSIGKESGKKNPAHFKFGESRI